MHIPYAYSQFLSIELHATIKKIVLKRKEEPWNQKHESKLWTGSVFS